MLAGISQAIVNLIRLNPTEFVIYCTVGSLVLIILSNPALLLKLALFGSMIITGFAIIAHQINMLVSVIQNTIISNIQQAFDDISRLLK
jgi:hypothetical protein